jgi:hypothetical protein
MLYLYNVPERTYIRSTYKGLALKLVEGLLSLPTLLVLCYTCMVAATVETATILYN